MINHSHSHLVKGLQKCRVIINSLTSHHTDSLENVSLNNKLHPKPKALQKKKNGSHTKTPSLSSRLFLSPLTKRSLEPALIYS